MKQFPNVEAIVFIISLMFAGEVLADDAIRDCGATDAYRVVMIAENAARGEMAPYIVSIASQMGDLPVCFRTEWREDPMPEGEAGNEIARHVAEESNAIVVFWLVPAFKGYQLRLFLPFRDLENEITREVEVAGDYGLAETIAVIVRVSISTAIADKNTLSKPENPAVAARSDDGETMRLSRNTKILKPKENARGRLQVSAAYYVGASSAKLFPTHGAALGLGVLTTDFLTLFAQYTVLAPLEFSSGGADVLLQRHPVWIGGHFFHIIGRLEMGASIALGIDYITERYSVLDENTDLQLEPDSRVQASIVPMINLSLQLLGILYLTTSLSGEIVLNQFRYSVMKDNEKITVYDPWPIQPALMIGLELRFL
jgi:hypothetical protein